MKIEVSMIREDDKFHANSWWAASPDFVLHTLRAHLAAAAVIWPDLKKYAIGTMAAPAPETAPLPQEPT